MPQSPARVRARSLCATRILSSTSIASFNSRARVRTLSGSSSCSTSQTISCQVLGGSLVRIFDVIGRQEEDGGDDEGPSVG
jgi:hypothetical protein